MSTALAVRQDLYRVQRERLTAACKVGSPAPSAKLVLLLPRIDDAIRRQLDRIADKSQEGPLRSVA